MVHSMRLALRCLAEPRLLEAEGGDKGCLLQKCKWNIRADVRARGRATRSGPRKAAAYAPSGTKRQSIGIGR